MKVVKKVLIILFIVLIISFGASYIDYYIVKTKETLPKLAIKEEKNKEQMVIYKALFYKVWYCKAEGSIIIGDYSDKEAVCPKSYVFEEGYYTNLKGLKISKRDISLMIDKGIITSDAIDLMSTQDEINNAVYVAYNYGKSSFAIVKDKTSSKINNALVVFGEFKEDKNGNYSWEYDEKNMTKYYCAKMSANKQEYEFAKYDDGKCGTTFSPIRLDEKWCKLYKNTALSHNEDLIGNYCKGK